MFSSPPEDGLNPFVFLIAALLAQKKPVALGARFLGTVYSRLDECARNIVRLIGRYNVVCYVDTNFLQLFLYELFFLVAPEAIEFELVP